MTQTAESEVVEELLRQNGTTLGRMLGRGSVGFAEEGSDGKMTGTIRIPEDELVHEPVVLILPHAGTVELDAHQRRQEHPLRGSAEQR